MKGNDSATCQECGAKLQPGAEVCDLCGTPVGGSVDFESGDAEHVEELAAPRPAAARRGAPVTVFCNDCGWKNPAGSRFCSQCGNPLQDLSAPSGRRPAAGAPVADAHRGADVYTGAEAPEKAAGGQSVGQRVGILLAAGTLLVAALFLVTVFSRGVSSEAPAAPASGTSAATTTTEETPAAPLAPELAERVATLRAEIEQATGEEKVAKQRELISVYFSGDRMDLAAAEQEKLAQTVNTTQEWTTLGHFYYDLMETREGEEKLQAGRKAMAAYERVLEQEPNNLDVRTNYATVLLNTNNPMEGVRQVKQVLDENPNHMQANFNYGVMLSMIGRRDEAIEQFEKVKTLVPEDSEEYRTADEAIRRIRAAAPSGPAQPDTPDRS